MREKHIHSQSVDEIVLKQRGSVHCELLNSNKPSGFKRIVDFLLFFYQRLLKFIDTVSVGTADVFLIKSSKVIITSLFGQPSTLFNMRTNQINNQ